MLQQLRTKPDSVLFDTGDRSGITNIPALLNTCSTGTLLAAAGTDSDFSVTLCSLGSHQLHQQYTTVKTDNDTDGQYQHLFFLSGTVMTLENRD